MFFIVYSDYICGLFYVFKQLPVGKSNIGTRLLQRIIWQTKSEYRKENSLSPAGEGVVGSMQLNDIQVKKLLLYQGKMALTQLGLSMLITRLSRKYQSNPSPQAVKSATVELNAFLEKFSMVMEKDYQWIIQL